MITMERLRALLSYSPETGAFTWKVRPRQRACREIAGTVNPAGYRQICVDQTIYKAHRLAWFYVHGVWPSNHVDHINGDRSDNRLCNLREADWSENQANSKCRVTNKSGFKGVSFHPASGLWMARVMKGGKRVFTEYFKTPQEAHEAYKVASARVFGEYARSA